MKAFLHLGDLASYSVVISTIAGVLPPLAALVSIAWACFQFYHSAPMKEWRAKRKEKKDGPPKTDQAA